MGVVEGNDAEQIDTVTLSLCISMLNHLPITRYCFDNLPCFTGN
jgi:hypothetical protein